MPRGPYLRNPIFDAPMGQRDHRSAALRDNSNRLQKYFDPNSGEGFPLTRLGAMAAGTNPIERWRTPINMLGMYIEGDLTTGDEWEQPLFRQVVEEAGLDPANSAGEIAIGPQFNKGPNMTVQHELMHKAINEYFPELVGGATEEVIIRQIINPDGTPEDRQWVRRSLGRDWDELFEGLADARELVRGRAEEQLREMR